MSWLLRPTEKSIACNGERLVELRKIRGWSQKEIAERAGYSDRLISKAESGNPITLEAIEILAETLSLVGQKVLPDDLIMSPLIAAKRVFQYFYANTVELHEHCLLLFDPEAEICIEGDPDQIPFAGDYQGPQGFSLFHSKLFGVLEIPPGYDPIVDLKFLASGTDVVVIGLSRLHPRGAPPMANPMPIRHLLQFKSNRVIRFENQFDTDRGAELIR